MKIRSDIRLSPLRPAFSSVAIAGVSAGFLAAPLHTAHAQVLDAYLPETGRGVGEVWQDREQARMMRAFVPQGVRLGGFLLSGTLDESAGYTDNANRLPGGAQSAVISTAATLGLASDWVADRLYTKASVTDMRYPSQSIENLTNWTASIGGFHDMGHDRLGFDYSHLNLVQVPNTLGGFATVQPVKYQVNRALLSYTIARDGRFSLMPEASLTDFVFDQGARLPSAIGVSVPQSYRNRAIITESLVARYRVTPMTSALLVLRGTEVRYTSALAGYPGRDSNGATALAGLDYDTGHLINLRILAGYQKRFYRNSSYSDFNTPVVEAEAIWAPSRLTRMDLTVRRGIEDSAFENVAGFTYTTLRLGLEHQYQRDILLSAHFTFQQGHYDTTPSALVGSILTQPGGNQTIVGGDLSAQWMVNRHLSLSLNYNIAEQNVVGSVGRFAINQVMIEASLKL